MVTANLKIIFGRLVRNNICQGDSFLTICGIKHFKLDEHHLHAGYNCTFIKSVLHFSTLHMVASYWEIYLCSIESIVNNSWTIGWDHCVHLETTFVKICGGHFGGVEGVLWKIVETTMWSIAKTPQCVELGILDVEHCGSRQRAVSDDGGHEISVLTFHTRHTLTCVIKPHKKRYLY